MGSGFEPVPDQELEELEADAVRLGCGGDRELFLKILERRGDTLDAYRARQREVRVVNPEALPEWARLLLHWSTVSADAPAGEGPLGWWRQRAREELRAKLSGLPLRLETEVIEQRADALLARLEMVVQAARDYRFSAVDVCFETGVEAGSRLGESWLGEAPQWPEWYRVFSFFPVLARLMALSFVNWSAATMRMLERLVADWPELRELHLAGPDPGSLCRILTPEGADPHSGGEQVQLLTFQSGARLVYKPRDLRLGSAFLELLGLWPDTAWRQRPMLARSSYCWDTFIEPHPCADEAGRILYFYRLGVLAALGELTNSRDMHRDNLVAVGSQPHILDLETVVHPFWHEEVEVFNVAQSCLLSHRANGLPGYRAVDLSVLAGTRVQPVPAPTELVLGSVPSLPEVADPGRYFEHIEAGNRAALDWLEQRRSELEPWLTRMSGCCFRHLYRNTEHYMRILIFSVRPDLLRSGTRREAYLEMLLRPSVSIQQAPQIGENEIGSLRDLDIPLFFGKLDHAELICEDGSSVDGYFRPHFTQRLRPDSPLFEPSRRPLQARSLRSLLGLARWGATPQEPALGRLEQRSPAAVDWLAKAVELGTFVLEAEQQVAPRASFTPWSDCWKLDCVASDLLSGSAGWAVVCAELAHHTDLQPFARAAARLAEKLSLRLKDYWSDEWTRLKRSSSQTLYCGAYHGLGGELYALERCARLLHRPDLSADVAHFCTELPLDLCRQRSSSGVALGTDGLVPVLLLHQPDRARQLLTEEPQKDPIPSGAITMDSLPANQDGRTFLRARAGLDCRPDWSEAPGSRLSWLGASRYGCEAPGDATVSSWLATGDPLDRLELALAAHEVSAKGVWLEQAAELARWLVERRSGQANWFPAWDVCDEHHPCALTGCGALCLAFLRLARPGQVPSLRLLEFD